MTITIIFILLALLQYQAMVLKTGTSRPKYGINAPSIKGDEIWERMFRVQQNTMEQLIVFIPGMLAFATYVDSKWVALPGIAFIVGRQLYWQAYVKAPESRALGFGLTFFANIGLIVVTLGFIVWGLIR